MEDEPSSDARRKHHPQDTCSMGDMAESQTFLSRHNNLVGTICEKTTSEAPPTRRKRTYSNLRIMENHLYECLYDIIRSDAPETDKFPALQRYKARIVRTHAERNARILLDATAHDRMEDEEPSLYHVLKMLRRRETRTIQ